jgi:hypothetical protein
VALTQTVALHGLGGVGKTQLAVEYAWKHLGGYTAVLWVRADSPEALDASLAELARLLGLPQASAEKQSAQTAAVLNWLKGQRHCLLIADNADTEEAAKAVSDRFPPYLGGHVLVTSRLGNWPVNMAHLSLDLLPASDAARYLQARVAKAGHPAGNDTAARQLAEELGYLPLALEQAASFILKLRWRFDTYRERLYEARPKLLNYSAEGGTRYPASVAKTWSITIERLGPLARALLRLAAWFAPAGIPRGIFLADPTVFSEALGESVDASDLAIEEALGELARFSLIRLNPETVSVHRLLQAVEQDALIKEERTRWLEWALRLFNAFAPGSSDDARTWSIWLVLRPHAEALLGKVFISYTWLAKQKDGKRGQGRDPRAFQLAERLRNEGFDSKVDVYFVRNLYGFVPPKVLPGEARDPWIAWSEGQIRDADCMLLLSTPEYVESDPDVGACPGRWCDWHRLNDAARLTTRVPFLWYDWHFMKSALESGRAPREKFIPVGFGPYDPNCIPEFVRGATYCNLESTTEFDGLIRRIRGIYLRNKGCGS